eukprot:m.8234 g.8234  ORF g.8234 m.8234 type:complete len:90 (-) comp6141_c0_seq2:2490-2759(-)
MPISIHSAMCVALAKVTYVSLPMHCIVKPEYADRYVSWRVCGCGELSPLLSPRVQRLVVLIKRFVCGLDNNKMIKHTAVRVEVLRKLCV